MAHCLIAGMTESGKTTLAKLICFQLSKRGIPTAVLDPLRDPEWATEKQFHEPAEFLAFVKANRSFVLFVDEGGQSIGRYNKEMEWLATQSRHFGHSCFFISQGVTQLPPIIRQQCSKFYVFACGESNSKLIAEECNEPLLKSVTRLQPGEFFEVSRFKKTTRNRIVFPKNSGSDRSPLDRLKLVPYNGGDAGERSTDQGTENEHSEPGVSGGDSRRNSGPVSAADSGV